MPKIIMTEKIGKPHLKGYNNLSMILLSNHLSYNGNKKKLNF